MNGGPTIDAMTTETTGEGGISKASYPSFVADMKALDVYSAILKPANDRETCHLASPYEGTSEIGK